MNTKLFLGELVRLVAEEPEQIAKSEARWGRNAEYIRLLFTSAVNMWSAKKFKEWIEKDLEKEKPEGYYFNIHTVVDDQLIGFCVLWQPEWSHRDTWLTIGIGEPEAWGKGYGTEAVCLLLRYAFDELNLHRVTLGTFGYNERAIRSYLKAGFVLEGRERQYLRRDGQRWDLVVMGLLAEEWRQKAAAQDG